MSTYNPEMSLLLAQAVEQAYQYYIQGPSYKINLPGYAVQSILEVWETDESVPIGFTAVGIQPGISSRNLVIFRGTQTDEESIEDMCWDTTPCTLSGVACGTAGYGVYNFYAGDDHGLVTSLETSVQNAVADLVNRKGASQVWYFAGHSLGGALSTLACLDAVVGGWLASQSQPQVTLYTYGSLHVGQSDFASAFNAAINPNNTTNAFRVANLADWVPSFLGGFIDIPDCESGASGVDAQGYVHVGQLCSYLWQTDGDWSNHALVNTYLKTLTNYPQVIKIGPRKYPQ